MSMVPPDKEPRVETLTMASLNGTTMGVVINTVPAFYSRHVTLCLCLFLPQPGLSGPPNVGDARTHKPHERTTNFWLPLLITYSHFSSAIGRWKSAFLIHLL